MDPNNQPRHDKHSEDESCSIESWEPQKNMCCPYMYNCPVMFEMMQYSEVKVTRDEDNIEEEDQMRSPRPGPPYHGSYGHHYGDYDHHHEDHDYYPYYPYPYYNRPRPWWLY